MDDLALRAGALVLFVAIFAGGVLAAEQAFSPTIGGGHGIAAGGIQLTSPESAKAAAPGTEVTFPLIVRNGGDAPVELALASAPSSPLAGRFVPDHLALGPGEARGAWATFALRPDHAAGPVRLLAQAERDGKAVASLPLALAVAVPADPAGAGEQVTLDYVGRFPNGTLFDTSLRTIGESPLAPAGFPARNYQPLQVVLGAQAGTIEGFWRGLEHIGVGQSKTFTLAPEQAYGAAMLRQDVPRQQDVPRLSQPYERVQHYARSVLAQNLNASSQVGDLLVIGDPSGNQRTYRITELDAVNATIAWQVRPGDNFTIYPIWPGQSTAFQVTNTTVVFRTTPAAPDQAVTYYQFWPNMTRVKAMNETALTLEHSPPVGYEFTIPQRGTNRVAAVSATTIAVETPNTHPLAGQTLVFDVTARAVRPAP